MEPRPFRLDLGRDAARLVAEGPDFPFTVTAGDPEEFRIRLEPGDREVDWYLELDWTYAGRTGTVRIPDSGHYRHYPAA